MRPGAEEQDEMPTVELEVDAGDLPRLIGGKIPEDTPVELRYDSAYGGEQTVRGRADKITHEQFMESGRTAGEARRLGRVEPGDVLIDDRIVSRGQVQSVRDRRRLGRTKRAHIQVPLDRALDVVDEYGAYDVDRGEGETIVQWWDGPTEDTYWERTGTVRLPHLEGGERVNERYEPYNSLIRERERY